MQPDTADAHGSGAASSDAAPRDATDQPATEPVPDTESAPTTHPASARDPRRTADPAGAIDPTTTAVLRAFFVQGKLQTVPAKRSKRLVVLDRLAAVFEPGVRYPESEVNTRLQAFHPDYALLRRYLVDEEFLTRDHGVYWRTGGSVDV